MSDENTQGELIEYDPPQQKHVEKHGASNPLDMPTKQFKAALARRRRNREALMEWIRESLVEGVDFMRVYSKKRKEWSKPFLTKAGAEKVLGMLGVTASFPDLDDVRRRLAEGSEIVVTRCELINQNGEVVGNGAGGRTLGQDYSDVNKALKMALKSAMIDATLRLGGLSEIFTQDRDSATEDDLETTIDKKQVEELTDLCNEIGLKVENVCKFYNIQTLSDLPGRNYLRAKKAILKKKDEKNEEEEGNEKAGTEDEA